MGYTLIIGEAELLYNEDLVRVDCSPVKRDDAPAYGEPTDYQSQRWPSYSSWADAMEKLGMMDVMFNCRNGGKGYFVHEGETRSPLLEVHPGETPITKEHVEEVENLLAAYKAKNPTHRAEYPPPKLGATPIMGDIYREEDYVDDQRYDSALCRGEWLAYWLRWAVENCEQPVFVNR